MAARTGSAEWEGTLEEGHGILSVASGLCKAPYSYGTRFADQPGTNPEELIGAAHAACVAMALASRLDIAGYYPQHLTVSSRVHLSQQREEYSINRIELDASAEVQGISNEVFQIIAEDAKNSSPVSRLLAGAEISIRAKLVGTPREEVVK
jgi:osmotically inducible protein OsmC